MAVRYVPKARSVIFVVDRDGKKRPFHPSRRLSDGTFGYRPEELNLTRDQTRMYFQKVEVSGVGVEQATAAPGEKRSLTGKGHQCDDCEFASRSAAGLAAHRRVHEGEESESE